MSATVILFPKQETIDGGKARMLRRYPNFKSKPRNSPDDLTMDHADKGMASDSPYLAPDTDYA